MLFPPLEHRFTLVPSKPSLSFWHLLWYWLALVMLLFLLCGLGFRTYAFKALTA